MFSLVMTRKGFVVRSPDSMSRGMEFFECAGPAGKFIQPTLPILRRRFIASGQF
jgi:hypothetical protein